MTICTHHQAADHAEAVFRAATNLVTAVEQVPAGRAHAVVAAWAIGYLHRHLGRPEVTVDGEPIPRIREAFLTAEFYLRDDGAAATYGPQIITTALEGVLRLLDAIPGEDQKP